MPEWGCFTGPDMNLANGILGEPNGVGSYIAFGNNPLDVRDPMGLSFWSNITKGDFDSEDTTWGGVAGQIGVGIIPIVGQVADARDTVASIRNVALNPKSGVAWAGFGGALVGWIPVAGDALKGGIKVGKKVAVETAQSVVQQSSKEVVQQGAKQVDEAIRAATDAAKSAAPLESMLQKVETLDFSTPRNGAVFYSGPGQGTRAATFAERTGGMTIEMTPGGKALASDPVFQALSPAEQYQVWQKASAPFAQGVSGRVNAFIQGARPTGTFRTIEEPIIRESIDVTKTTYHY